VCSLRLRDLIVWFRLTGVNQVGKLHSILNKENRDIVPNNIEVSCTLLASYFEENSL
jgi:hypothetical protein